MWRVLLVIVVLADPDLISSVGSTRGRSLGNTLPIPIIIASAVVACIVGCGGVECGLRFPPYRHKVWPAADSQQPDRSVKKNIIRLSVVNPPAVALGQMQ
jgi:hypothetical protein